MKKVHLINAKHPYAHSSGEYTNGLFIAAKDYFQSRSWQIETSFTHGDYNIQEEVEKLNSSDLIITHTPFWWMGLPWSLKKYIDEVLTEGHGILYTNDGRSRKDQGKLYGSGGLKHDTKYMLTMIMNAPASVFNNKNSLFEGASVDEVTIQFHKTFQFLGMMPAKTFTANDVMKEPQFENDKAQYLEHLSTLFDGE